MAIGVAAFAIVAALLFILLVPKPTIQQASAAQKVAEEKILADAKANKKELDARNRKFRDEWKALQRGEARLDKTTENALWQRFSAARNGFDKTRRAHFAQLDEQHASAKAEKQRLVAEVRDEGDGFDLDACTENPAHPANIAREDGRGLFLMRALMDRVERFTDGGNVVRLVLHRP